MVEFNSISEIVQEIKNKLIINPWSTKKHILTLYAFNGTWKTRISTEINLLNEDLNGDEIEKMIESWDSLMEPTRKVLCYNAFLEDLFYWDNDKFVLFFNPNSWEAELIQDQWLENRIIENFQRFLNTKTEPYFDLEHWTITFNIPSWDEDSQTEIKISRWEESIFVWSVFYTILELVINELNSNLEDRSTDLFNDLEYIVIDDPVSSIDDTRIITLAIELIELIKLYNTNKIKFLITTHHALFYNVLYNSFNWDKQYKDFWYILSKNENKLKFELQKDSPFWYHLLVKDEIKKAINESNIQKYHFNLFRWLLEKTSNFLWIKNWGDCINWDKKEEFIRLVNLYSHNRLEPMEYREVSDDEKVLFNEKFTNFINEYKYFS